MSEEAWAPGGDQKALWEALRAAVAPDATTREVIAWVARHKESLAQAESVAAALTWSRDHLLDTLTARSALDASEAYEPCPRCEAAMGERCQDQNEEPHAPHLARRLAFLSNYMERWQGVSRGQ